MTKQEIAAELNAIQATIDRLLDQIVCEPKPKSPAKSQKKATVGKR
jgi:hypothetical protein